MNNIGIVIQARTGSTRLPNKMKLPFYQGESVLEILLQKLLTKYSTQQIVLATTTANGDDSIEAMGKNANVNVFRGSEQDVLNRFIESANTYGFAKIVRICADNPFLDIDGLWKLTEQFKASDADYLAYALSDGTPTIKTHYGFWAECVTLNALNRVQQATSEKVYHEHVTNYIHSHQDIFSCEFIPIPRDLEQNKKIRLTLDTQEDFDLQKEIYAALAKQNEFPKLKEVIAYIEKHPSYYEIMHQQIINNSK